MPQKEKVWPSEVDLRRAEDAEYVVLSRVLAALRRLSSSELPSRSTGVSMSRETVKLVDALCATQVLISLLGVQLRDGTATPDEQRCVADKVEELLDLLRSHAADVDAGIVSAPHHLLLAERHSS